VSSVQEVRQASLPAAGFEEAPCPKCGSRRGAVVATGRDYLYGVPGFFSAWQCDGCGLQYQNPRPTADRLADLYPAGYGPHGGSAPDRHGPESGPTLKGSLKRAWPLSAVWPRLHEARAALREGWARLGRAAAEFPPFHPVRACLPAYLRERMGYGANLPEPRNPWRLVRPLFRRGCRRLVGVELIPIYVPCGRLLEIGCAKGDRLRTLRDWGWGHLEGIELVAPAAAQARAHGFPVRCEPVESALSHYPDDHFDVIVTSMVLEHLHNPFAVVREIARKLKPGGEFLFSTVTRDGLDARLFGPFWAGYDFPRHMVYFRNSDLREMLGEEFTQVELFWQNEPIDYVRSASWRRPEGRVSDRLLGAVARSPLGWLLGALLARLSWTTRVSVRCRKKS
jgi:SAM-dependent methyltransferase